MTSQVFRNWYNALPRPAERSRPHGAPLNSAGGDSCAGRCGKTPQRPNTYTTVAFRISLSSGALMSRRCATALGPEAIARYCLPLTAKVIGGAVKPDPTFNFHTSSSVRNIDAPPYREYTLRRP